MKLMKNDKIDMPEAKLNKAAALWQSKNPDDWSKANALVFQYRSPFGRFYQNGIRPLRSANAAVTISARPKLALERSEGPALERSEGMGKRENERTGKRENGKRQ